MTNKYRQQALENQAQQAIEAEKPATEAAQQAPVNTETTGKQHIKLAPKTQEAIATTRGNAEKSFQSMTQLAGHTVMDMINQSQAYRENLLEQGSEAIAYSFTPDVIVADLMTRTVGKLASLQFSDCVGLASGQLPQQAQLQSADPILLTHLLPPLSESKGQNSPNQGSSEQS